LEALQELPQSGQKNYDFLEKKNFKFQIWHRPETVSGYKCSLLNDCVNYRIKISQKCPDKNHQKGPDFASGIDGRFQGS
jgi:hypothetical protein